MQIETIDAVGSHALWVSMVRLEGHLGLGSSVEAAFSPDGGTLAVAGKGSVVLFDLKRQEIKRVLKPHVEDMTDLNVLSANFLDDFNILRSRPRQDTQRGSVKGNVREISRAHLSVEYHPGCPRGHGQGADQGRPVRTLGLLPPHELPDSFFGRRIRSLVGQTESGRETYG